jgi:thioredoxin reductase (NADPH)
MFIRGASLEHSMSHYLAERVASLPNVTLHTRIELTALEGMRASSACTTAVQVALKEA